MTTVGSPRSAAPRRGSRDSTLHQLRRVISILAWLRRHPDATLMSTADRFGMSVPQLREELVRVQESGLPGLLPGSLVDLTVEGARVVLHDAQGIDRPLSLSHAEADVLGLNLEKLASILADEERADTDAAAEHIRSLHRPSSPRGHTDGSHGPGTTSPTATALALLREATASRRWVSFSYLSLSTDLRTVREIIPDQVDVVDGAGYLWGRSDDDDRAAEQKSFAVSRMDAVTILDRAAPDALPRQIDADDPFGFTTTTRDWAQLTLTEDAMWMLEYLPVWLIDGTRVEIPDTGAWLERFIAAYAPEITAVEPETVAGRVSGRCAAALAAYRRLA